MEIELNSTCKRIMKVVEAEMNNEMVMMEIETGSYFGVNEVGARIWKLLAEPKTVSDICDTLQLEFEVDADTCVQDVKKYLEQLIEDKLITVE